MATSNKLIINERVSVPLDEVEISAVRSSGPGGQHVNKSNTAVQLRFSIAKSSLPDAIKSRLFAVSDRRLNAIGEIVIKARVHKSQQRNREEALERLANMIRKAAEPIQVRRATKPSRGSIKRRLEHKAKRSHVKFLRGRVKNTDE